jgi:hypothetical protein
VRGYGNLTWLTIQIDPYKLQSHLKTDPSEVNKVWSYTAIWGNTQVTGLWFARY